jgi:hypothetical protein
MAGNTALDLLIAEMLGDISKLHAAVDSLKEQLPHELDAAEERITSLIGLLRKAGDAYQGQIETYTASKLRVLQAQMEREGDAAATRMDRTVEATLLTVQRTVDSTIHASMAKPIQNVFQTLKRSMWMNLGYCFLAGLLGGSVPVIVWSRMH